jgi:hypothetical protein
MIYVDHHKLIRFEELALELAEGIETHCQIEVNINPEKTQAVVNLLLLNYNPARISSMVFMDPGKFEEFRMIALDISKASNSNIKIDIHINQEKTKAQANIMLLGVNKI